MKIRARAESQHDVTCLFAPRSRMQLPIYASCGRGASQERRRSSFTESRLAVRTYVLTSTWPRRLARVGVVNHDFSSPLQSYKLRTLKSKNIQLSLYPRAMAAQIRNGVVRNDQNFGFGSEMATNTGTGIWSNLCNHSNEFN